MNKLYYGDCLTVMQHMKAASVDLIYLDPPFNSKKNYHGIYKDETGRPIPDQIEAFCDMWALTEEREREIQNMPILVRETGISDEVAEFWRIWMGALRQTNPPLLAYLSYMTVRLAHMRVLLKPTGSLYLHCDPTASHYIKVILDGVFGHANFMSEIVWKRTSAHSSADRPGAIHDVLLLYCKDKPHTWNPIYQEYDETYIDEFYTHIDPDGRRWMRSDLTGAGTTAAGDTGQPWRGIDVTTRGRHWAYARAELDRLDHEGKIHWPQRRGGMPRLKRYLDEQQGVPLQDVWTDIKPIHNLAEERMGYATQKPLKLIERIIKVSTNKGDTVLDPFCGCASTLEAAHNLQRKWIGIDIAIHAIKRVSRIRLQDRCGLVEGTDFEINGVPRNLEGASDLWNNDKYQFQKWAVEQVEGFVTTRQTADGGIDGRLYFAVPDAKDLQSMVIEVKGGATVDIRDVRALGDVLRRDDALLAGLIVLHELPARKETNIKRLMAEAGNLDVLGTKYPRMQMLTVQQIFAGEQFRTPSVAARMSVKPMLPLG